MAWKQTKSLYLLRTLAYASKRFKYSLEGSDKEHIL